jgi:DNA-directed RNA polymerase specialized sigma24 family protein
MTDRQLLDEFAGRRSRRAFAALVDRHAGMVYSTCLRMLGERPAAEQATQASFMILARKADRVAPGSLAGWLYKTTYDVCCRARRAEASRRGEAESDRLSERQAVAETSYFVGGE